jgi:serine protease Do
MDIYENNDPGLTPESSEQTPPELTEVSQSMPLSPLDDTPDESNLQECPPTCEEPKAADEKPKKKRGRRVWKILLPCIVAIALVISSCGITAFCVNGIWQYRNAQTIQALNYLYDQIQGLKEQIKDNSYTGNGNSISGSPNTGVDGGMTPGQVYAQCVDSVVAIVATTTSGTSSGSGFILSADGYILTNYHVVENATSLTVTTDSGTEYPAVPVGYDDRNDIALIRIEAQDLPYVTLGSSDDLIVGDQVVAIGNPLGELTSTLTVGYISAKERDVTTDGTVINMLQTDAAINAGNSGGPLFNMKGEVVGIITAKYSGSTSSGASIEGIGFAIPIDDVTEKIQQIKDYGYVSTPYMGVSVDNRNAGVGAYVVSVETDGGAYAAGIRAGDIIMALGDHQVTSVEYLTKALKNFKVGDTTTVTVLRGRKLVDLTITLAEKPRASQPTSSETLPSDTTQTPSNDSIFPDWWDDFFGFGG